MIFYDKWFLTRMSVNSFQDLESVIPGQVLTKHSWPLDLDYTDMTSVSPVVTGPAPGQDQGQLQVMPTAGSWRVPFKGRRNISSF